MSGAAAIAAAKNRRGRSESNQRPLQQNTNNTQTSKGTIGNKGLPPPISTSTKTQSAQSAQSVVSKNAFIT